MKPEITENEDGLTVYTVGRHSFHELTASTWDLIQKAKIKGEEEETDTLSMEDSLMILYFLHTKTDFEEVDRMLDTDMGKRDLKRKVKSFGNRIPSKHILPLNELLNEIFEIGMQDFVEPDPLKLSAEQKKSTEEPNQDNTSSTTSSSAQKTQPNAGETIKPSPFVDSGRSSTVST